MGSKSQQQVQATPSATAALLVVMYIAAFVAAFNENIINVVLHDIMAAFSVSATTAQWLVSGYMIVTSIFTAIMAFLSGRFSTRKLLFFACGCMVAGEVLCLIAPSFSVLLPSRILQAAGSGILFPLMMNVVLSCAPREKLGLYLSLGGACITLGPAFGPVISGLMCTLFGWRAVFVVPLVGGIVVAAAGVKLVQNVGERSSTTLDILSVVLLAAGITAFVYSVGEFSTNPIAGIVALFAAIVLLGLFAARQLKLEHPVLNVRPMASVRFWPACLLVVVSMMTTFSMSVLLPLYFEGAYGMTALIAGLLILPAIACNAVTSIVGGRVMDARGAWPLLPVGFALIAVGQTAISMTAASMNIGVVVALTHAGEKPPYLAVISGHLTEVNVRETGNPLAGRKIPPCYERVLHDALATLAQDHDEEVMALCAQIWLRYMMDQPDPMPYLKNEDSWAAALALATLEVLGESYQIDDYAKRAHTFIYLLGRRISHLVKLYQQRPEETSTKES